MKTLQIIRNFILLLIFSFQLISTLSAQDSGVIKFDRTVYYSKIIDALPYLSKEEKNRQKLVWGKDEGWANPYVLKFNADRSTYTYGVKERENNFSWRQDEYFLVHDLKENKVSQQMVVGGKLFLIEDRAPGFNWKILNEIREVAGFLCMKAETRDTIKNQTIAAWFTTEIRVSDGPEGFYGLPGMILMLEINEGTAIIEASEVILDEADIEVPDKIKGKKIAMAEYHGVLEEYFRRTIERERNPFWGLRY